MELFLKNKKLSAKNNRILTILINQELKEDQRSLFL